ncbi:hypothetical protein EJ08DRAFT_382191 [Tothia fuscella]|uniref:Integral membrane protein n=1 Tax=Tothia fuscella TaxID=1048955 RepID=A0A9P4NKI9_9PEZI|nr:hypothetical protein EJ08DRAFT_382191 [Tothia fuscella]
MRALLLLASAASFLFSNTWAQSVNAAPSSTADIPPCALACQTLFKAESACSPSNPAAVLRLNTTDYKSCMCQSNLLTPLLKGANGPCDVECPLQKDREAWKRWYGGYCKEDSASTTTSSTAAASSTQTSTSQSTTSTTIAAAAATTTSPTSSEATTPKRRNGLSKSATIGVAVGISVLMVLVAVGIYFPLLRSAGRAMRSGTPIPLGPKEEEERVGESDGDTNAGSAAGPKKMIPRNDEEGMKR